MTPDDWREAHDRVAEQLAGCIEDYNRLKVERDAVIDVLNIYADRAVHDQLDAAGLLMDDTTARTGKEPS